jgi:hypothetical protein
MVFEMVQSVSSLFTTPKPISIAAMESSITQPCSDARPVIPRSSDPNDNPKPASPKNVFIMLPFWDNSFGRSFQEGFAFGYVDAA